MAMLLITIRRENQALVNNKDYPLEMKGTLEIL
ncbi:Uncharacterised protein [Streptococcus pneumoniae]|jgi:hypothetical protein|nr:Uncharacterised protein [Streptococcus pneumoniae]